MELWLDLAWTDEERRRFDEALGRGAASARVVVTASERRGPGFINVNDDLFADDSIAAQRAVVSAYEHALDSAAAAHPDLRDLLDALRVPYYEANIYEIAKWAAALERATRGVDASNLVVYVPSHPSTPAPFHYEAEGEVSKSPLASALYRRTDFLAAVLVAHLRRRGVSEFRTFRIRRGWPGELRLRRHLRAYGVLAVKGAWHAWNRLRHRAAPVPANLATTFVAVSRSSVHTDYLAALLKQLDSSLVVFESERTYPNHLRASRRLLHNTRVPVVHGFDLIGAVTIAALWLRVCARLLLEDLVRRRDVVVDVPALALSFSLRQGIREGIVQTFETEMLLAALSRGRITAPNARTILHCEMTTQYASVLARMARNAGLACYQVAFGTYQPKPIPAFVPGDGFLCFSLRQQTEWAGATGTPQRLLYAGNLQLTNATAAVPVSTRVGQKRMAFFSQPYANDEELRLVKELRRICAAHGRELAIVLHPRDQADKFDGLGIEVIGNVAYLARRDELEDSFFVAVTRVSNVVYQLILRRVPCVNLLVSPSDAVVVQEYYDWGAPLFYSIADFEAAVAKPDELLRRCLDFVDRYIEGSFANKGADSMARWLTETT